MELAGLLHVSLQGGEEDLGGVAEYNDSDRNREFLHINIKLYLLPRPLPRPGQAIGNNQDVDDKVRQSAEEAELGHRLEVLQERARQERSSGHNRPGFLGDGEPRETVVHQVAADHNVKNTSHDQLDDLSHVHYMPTQRGEAGRAAGVGDVNVGIPHAHFYAVFVLLVQTGDEDFSGVAAHHSREDNEEEAEVSAVEDGVRQSKDEHALRTEKRSWVVMDEAHIAVTGRASPDMRLLAHTALILHNIYNRKLTILQITMTT